MSINFIQKVFSIILLTSMVGCTLPGIKFAINLNAIELLKNKLIPLAYPDFENLVLPNQETTVLDQDVTLSNLNFHINPVNPSNLAITLDSPNIINISGTGISGDGTLVASFPFLFWTLTYNVDATIQNVAFSGDIVLSEIEQDGQSLPFGQVSNLNVDISLTFEASGGILADLADLLKGPIASYVTNELNASLAPKIQTKINAEVSKLISKIPSSINVYNGIAVDYTLASAPKIQDNYVVLPIVGKVEDSNFPSTLNPPFNQTELPDFNSKGFSIQAFLSEYSLQTLINSFYVSNQTDFMILSTDIPQTSPIQLTTSGIGRLIEGLEEKYGENKPINLQFVAQIEPSVQLIPGKITGNAIFSTTFWVESASGYVNAVTFDLNLDLEALIQVDLDAHITGQISDVTLVSNKIVSSTLPSLTIEDLDIVLDFIKGAAISALNLKLKNIAVTLPTFDGISLDDSKAIIYQNYVKIDLSPSTA